MLTTNSDRAILYGVMAFIAYELYQLNHGGGGCAAPSPINGQQTTPVWVQQLSEYESGHDYFTPQCGIFGRCYQ